MNNETRRVPEEEILRLRRHDERAVSVLHQRGDGTALLILHTEYIEIRRRYFQLVVVLSYRLRGISAQGKERTPRTSV